MLQTARHIGLDLAWMPANRSGAAVLAADGTLLDATAELRTDDEILAWVRSQLGDGPALIAIDMPTIVPNPAGRRTAEAEIQRDFGRWHAGAYPANRGLRAFADGGRAAALIRALAADGVAESLPVAPDDPRRLAIEVFPHAAHVALFALPQVIKYKKKGRPWESVLAEWARYRGLLADLARSDPPLILPAWSVPLTAERRGYKRFDDLLDGITCAYVAAYVRRWGTAEPRTHVYGDTETGYIVVPTPRGLPQKSWQAFG